MTAGFLIIAALPARATAILFVVGEVALFIFIRDSLILNFIGLVLGRRFI